VTAVVMDEEHSVAQREGWKGHHTTSMGAMISPFPAASTGRKSDPTR
jgi:hypothetical protein